MLELGLFFQVQAHVGNRIACQCQPMLELGLLSGAIQMRGARRVAGCIQCGRSYGFANAIQCGEMMVAQFGPALELGLMAAPSNDGTRNSANAIQCWN